MLEYSSKYKIDSWTSVNELSLGWNLIDEEIHFQSFEEAFFCFFPMYV